MISDLTFSILWLQEYIQSHCLDACIAKVLYMARGNIEILVTSMAVSWQSWKFPIYCTVCTVT